MEQRNDHKQNTDGTTAKLRAFIAGLTPTAIFKYTFTTSVIIALAAGIIFHTATDSKHVRISPVNTATVVLSGADDLGGIGLGEYKSLSYSVENRSTKPAYVFVRIEEATAGLYEVTDLDGWCEVTTAESEGELIYA